MCAVKAATWTLLLPGSPTPESTELLDDHRPESVYHGDGRKRVDNKDFCNGGVYRCESPHFVRNAPLGLLRDIAIVKIQSGFQGPGTEEMKWFMGTGWLIRDDVLVTAGHLVYDRTNHRAVSQIKCYIGYNGAQSVPSQGSLPGLTSCDRLMEHQVLTPEELRRKPGTAARSSLRNPGLKMKLPLVGTTSLSSRSIGPSPGNSSSLRTSPPLPW